MSSELSEVLEQYRDSLNPMIDETHHRFLSISSNTSDLQAYVSKLFYDVFMQDDDEISEMTYLEHWSPQTEHEHDVNGGASAAAASFRAFVAENRGKIKHRRLEDRVFDIAPRGGSTWVTYTCHFSGVLEGGGEEVCMKVVLGLVVRLREGTRVVETREFSSMMMK